MTDTPKNKGAMRINISVIIPHPQSHDHGAQLDCEPIFFDIAETLPAKLKELPQGALSEVRKVMEVMCEAVRLHVHLTPEQIKQVHDDNMEIYKQQKIAGIATATSIEDAVRQAEENQIIGGPRVEVYRPGQAGVPDFQRDGMFGETGLELSE